MKNILMLVTVVAITVNASVAQTSYGAKAGVNIANVAGDDFDDSDGRTSMFFGGFVKIEMSDKFVFQPELLYSMQGLKESYSDAEESEDITVKLNYLNIPLMARYYLTEGFSVHAGPQVGFLLSAKMDWEFTEGGVTETGEEDIKDDMKKLDFGFNIGAGYELENGVGFDIRYNLGLSNMSDVDDADVKNRVFQISVSYSF